MRHRWRIILLAGSLAGGAAGARAETSLTQKVAPFRQRAAKLAAKKQWDPALKAISDAKELVRLETRREVTVPKRKIDPRFYQELAAVQKSFKERARKAGTDPARRKQLKAEFDARYAALSRKYHVSANAESAAAGFGQQQVRQARSGLLLASLDETAATYFTGKGDRDRAEASREDAALTRLRSFIKLKQTPQAEHAADALLKLQPANPLAYSEAAEFYQERQKWERAAPIWEAGITKLRSGKARMRVPNRPGAGATEQANMLGLFYKQVAFCYQQLGRAKEAQQAMQAARSQAHR